MDIEQVKTLEVGDLIIYDNDEEHLGLIVDKKWIQPPDHFGYIYIEWLMPKYDGNLIRDFPDAYSMSDQTFWKTIEKVNV